MEVVYKHMRSRDHIKHGQVLWTAVSIKDPPAGIAAARGHRPRPRPARSLHGRRRATAHRPSSRSQRLLHRARRLCQQAYDQGGLLSNCDIAEMLHVSVTTWASCWPSTSVHQDHRPATCHASRRRNGITHKRIICWKRYAEGRSRTSSLARRTTVSRPWTAISGNTIASATAASRGSRPSKPPTPCDAACAWCGSTSRSTICWRREMLDSHSHPPE